MPLPGSLLLPTADMEPEEIEPLVYMNDPCLLLGQAQPQPGQHLRHFCFALLGVVPFSMHHDDKVIRVTDDLPVAQPLSAPFVAAVAIWFPLGRGGVNSLKQHPRRLRSDRRGASGGRPLEACRSPSTHGAGC